MGDENASADESANVEEAIDINDLNSDSDTAGSDDLANDPSSGSDEIDINDLNTEDDASPESDQEVAAAAIEKKRKNAQNARRRLKAKQAKELARRMESGLVEDDDGESPPAPPKVEDYLTDDVIETKYDGNSERARNALLIAQTNHTEAVNAFHRTAKAKRSQKAAQLNQAATAEESFVDESEKWNIKNFDSLVETAEQTMGGDNALVIKQSMPEAAPLLLAHLGANPAIADKFLDEATVNPSLALANMAVLGNKLLSRAKKAKSKPVSQAKTETAPQGGGGKIDDIAKLEKAVTKARDSGNFKEYASAKNRLAEAKKVARAG
jgi:hypothetical protein